MISLKIWNIGIHQPHCFTGTIRIVQFCKRQLTTVNRLVLTCLVHSCVTVTVATHWTAMVTLAQVRFPASVHNSISEDISGNVLLTVAMTTTDINECSTSNLECVRGTHNCQQECTNTQGSFVCRCRVGYVPSNETETACIGR